MNPVVCYGSVKKHVCVTERRVAHGGKSVLRWNTIDETQTRIDKTTPSVEVWLPLKGTRLPQAA